MDTLDFFRRVLPTEGLYCIVSFDKDHPAPRHGFFNSVEELAKVAQALDARGNTTYYAIASYKEKKRKQDLVSAIKVVALDIDCGENKPYPTYKEGLVALGKFVAQFKLPKPVVVFSGGGLHVYWVLTEAVTTSVWKPLADAIKTLALNNDFFIDPAVTGDSARILRPVGTTNYKNGNKVKLLVDAEPVDIEDLRSLVSKYIEVPRAELTTRTGAGSSLLQSLAVRVEFAPARADKVASSCAQIQWAVENQEKVEEPLWYGLLGVAAYCEDPEQVVVDWSQNHPSFNKQTAITKMVQWKERATGPTTCKKFQDLNAGLCKGCKFKDKISSPAILGATYQEAESEAAKIDPIVSQVSLPRAFKRTTSGIVIKIDDNEVPVCSFDIYPVGYGKDESLGYEVVRYMWNRPHVGWTELILRQAHLVDNSSEFGTTIADQGIVLESASKTKIFQMLLRSYMDELKRMRGLTNLYASMGWKEGYDQFVLGNTLLRRMPDGTVTTEFVNLASSISKATDQMYGTSGSLDEWVKFTALLQKAGMVPHKFLLGFSFATPLLKMTGIKGLTLSIYGETGAGKTLGQLMMQSVWGNPDQLHFGGKFTQNSMFSRLSTHGNLPMTIDETTMMDANEVGDMLYWVTQGKDKARLSRTAEERASRDFQTTATLSTNKSIQSMLYAGGSASDAQLARLLEFYMPVNPVLAKGTAVGRQLYMFLMGNYGHAGVEFIKRVMEIGEDRIKAMVQHAIAEFPTRYGVEFSGDERFWEVGVVLSDLGNRLAKDFGLVQYDIEDATEWALSELVGVKKSAQANRIDAFDLIGEFINEHMDSTLTVMHTEGQKPMKDNTKPYIGEILARYDLYRKSFDGKFTSGTVMIERTKIRKWLSKRGIDFKGFLREFEVEGIIATPKSQKAYFGKDVGIKIPQCYVIGVNLNHPRLQGILDDAEQAVGDLSLGQIQAVS